jgi:group I intron endonuclease
METKIYIYSLTDPITNKIRYIGKSVNPNQRYSAHISRSKERKTHTNCWIYGLLKKGLKPILNVIEECDESNWIEREKYHISLHENLTNLTEGGEGIHGFKVSEESKKKMSEAHKGEKNHFYGKTHSEETRKKLSDIIKAKNTSSENNHFYGKTHSNESIKIISNKAKNRWERGDLHLPPVMVGEDNPSTKKRLFISPDGVEYIVYGMEKFCKEHNLSYTKIKKSIDKGKIPTPTEKKDIDRQRPKSKNTIGWEVITL